MTTGPQYDGLVFDMDGVLVEPTRRPLLTWAVERTFLEFGVEHPDADLVASLCSSDVSHLQTVETRHGIDRGTFWERRERNAAAEQMAAMKRGEKALYDDAVLLDDVRVPIGLVSNNQQETVEFVLDAHGVVETFDTAYGRYPSLVGARRAKPNAYYLERALDDLRCSTPLYVGDSAVDVAAAAAAGIDVALLRRPELPRIEPDIEPTHVIESLHELGPLVETRGGA
ncbi:HAD-IA family hydrolase [Haloarculaceae archaeon H-GB2-1]|nr:HAD-IA family hydrolase [Haloarculaceae archaeon H-GB1-1]MEA5386353.1 HAD-IA family hydrolase [Haloarculaceae archaeon H-GB11]MEA5407856.1 HAD-IA family hydrolase [Haloarculaceae archaeon H-GB2-1]